tara:strand:- start:14670 stop:15926 length:1257 start_codon:yes stop_codon:yes gene_type:complete
VPRVRQYQGGFIITLELILVSTILVIGTFIGVVALRDVLFKQYVEKQSRDIYVSDSNGLVLGQALSFDQHEAPRIPYIDRLVPPLSPDPAHRNYRALISIRDDRFTTREAVYYDGENCTGTPCIKAPSDENEDNIGIDNVAATGAVGYLYKSQAGPTYAIGRSPNGITGYLFRDTGNACPISPDAVRSRYMSEKVVTGSPCESLETSSTETTPGTTTTTQTYVADAYTDCLIGLGAIPGGVVDTCSCPANYSEQNDVIRAAESEIDASLLVGLNAVRGFAKDVVDVVEAADLQVGTVCCPVGSVLSNTGLADTIAYAIIEDAIYATLTDARKIDKSIDTLNNNLNPQTIVCVEETTTTTPGTGGSRSLVLREATQVLAPDTSDNALANFTAPFKINLPADASSDDWVYTLPGKEGPND